MERQVFVGGLRRPVASQAELALARHLPNLVVMPALVAGISLRDALCPPKEMAGTSPAMTIETKR
jgi:hypothetical protein